MGFNEMLAARGIELNTLGAAYLFVLGNLCATTGLFMLSRASLVITPNRAAKHYGLYVVVVLMSLIIATSMENELVPLQATTLQYAAVPHLLILLIIHLCIYYQQEPWLVALGASAVLGAVVVVSIAAVVSDQIHAAHWLALGLTCVSLGFLCFHSVSTKRGFIKLQSKKQERPQIPWLGLTQWVALTCASLLFATVNSILRGRGLGEILAVQVLTESSLLLIVTASVCAIPTITYWLAHKNWMPELTRFVWLVWLIVGFAFAYGNYLTSLDRV